MHNRKRPASRAAHGRPADNKRADHPGRPCERDLKHVSRCADEAPLEKLQDNPPRKTSLKLRSASAQNRIAMPLGPPARRIDQRRLAQTSAPLDHQQPAAPLQQHLDRHQLALSLEQLVHAHQSKEAIRNSSTNTDPPVQAPRQWPRRRPGTS